MASHTLSSVYILWAGSEILGLQWILVEHSVETKIHVNFTRSITSANDLGQLGKQCGHP